MWVELEKNIYVHPANGNYQMKKRTLFFFFFLKTILLSLVILELHLLKILPCLSLGTSAEETKKWADHQLPRAPVRKPTPHTPSPSTVPLCAACGWRVRLPKAGTPQDLAHCSGRADSMGPSIETSTNPNRALPGPASAPADQSGGEEAAGLLGPLRKRTFLSRTFYNPRALKKQNELIHFHL